MKKSTRVFCAILALSVSFILGWRVMPRAWPRILKGIVYPVFPQLKPPAPEPELYEPRSTAAMGDPVMPGDSLVYYFYKDYCPYCRELEPLTAGLPERITLPDGTSSDVRLVCVNKVEERGLELITGYYEAHGIPEERRYVPAVVIGDRYLFTDEEIIPQMMNALAAGEGLATPVLDGSARVP